ncbi:MAG: TetR/AcrR family transcriptional regulator [Bacteroidota bacterium]
MSLSTKEKIMAEATRYFNEVGFGAVTLFELARELNMSRGNLAYHFKDKEALLAAIAGQMWQKIERERSKSRQLPSFENLHNEVQLYYKFQREYAFIFLDHHVLNHPVIKEDSRKMTTQTIQDNKAAIAFSIRLGNMKPEPYPGVYNNLAFISWMMAFFWLPQQVIRGEKTEEDGEKMIWSMLVPHLTEKGLESFQAFFGEAYLQSLGEVFDLDLHQFISF